jgi:hypothetical protein
MNRASSQGGGSHSSESGIATAAAAGGQPAANSEGWVATHGKKFLEDARERLMIGNDPK